MRRLRRHYTRSLAQSPPSIVRAVARELLRTPGWTTRLVAYELLAGHREAFASLRERDVVAMGRGLSDWGSVDLFGVTVSGPAWRMGLVSDRTVQRWAKSSDRWQRRLALVSTVALNSRARGGSGDMRRTLPVCRGLVADREDMVVKAMSWALREAVKRDAAAVRQFISKHEGHLAPRVLREVRSKLLTGRKS
ncbi:MAG: DNA alkylation repair protein [Gemmatimonadaceae bacterium]